jgi:hypothetical protein
MNQIRLIYNTYMHIYILKCYNETTCVAVLNTKKYHFFLKFVKLENRSVEQVLPEWDDTSGWERKWRMCVGVWIWWKYCVHIYVNGKMTPFKTIPGNVGLRVKENWEHCKFQNVPLPRTIKKNQNQIKHVDVLISEQI